MEHNHKLTDPRIYILIQNIKNLGLWDWWLCFYSGIQLSGW